MPTLDELRADLTQAMKARDAVRTASLRMVIAAVNEAQVAGDSARQLGAEEITQLIGRLVKQRVEAAEAYEAAGRHEQAAAERADQAVLEGYLPARLDEAELSELIDRVLEREGLSGSSAMGPAMKLVQAEVAGRADGKTVAALVKSRLAG